MPGGFLNQLEKLVRWHKLSKGPLESVMRGIPIIMCLILMAGIVSLLGTLSIHLPRLSAAVILVCALLPAGVLIYSLFGPKHFKEQLWRVSTLSASVLFVIAAGSFLTNWGAELMPIRLWAILYPEKTEFPLGDVDGIAVDGDGRTYLAIPFYQRIQVYDNKGVFLRSWFIKSAGGEYDIWADENILHVLVSRTDMHFVMSSEGEVLRSSVVSSFDEWRTLHDKGSKKTHKDANGNLYSLEESWWFPRVVKTDPRGDVTVLISDPFHRWLIKAPFPAWLVALWGGLMIVIVRIAKLRYGYRQMLSGPPRPEQS